MVSLIARSRSGHLAAGMLALVPAFALVSAAPARPLTLSLNDGRTVRLTDLRGQVVVLNLWATWCEPCRREVPLLNALHAAHRRDGLTVIGVALDPARDGRGRWVSPWIRYPQARTMTGAYAIRGGVPTSYVIGRDGTLRHVQSGVFTRAELERAVLPLL